MNGVSMRILLLAGFSLAIAISSQARKQETGFLDRVVVVDGVAYKYQVFVPENWSPKQKWPIVLFLHGAGERGEDGLLQTQVGIGEDVRKERSRFPAVIVMPQCRREHWWSVADMQKVALAALAAASKEFKGDPNRTYLTGLSMGGYGTWAIAAANPHKFAAIVPICGGITAPKSLAQKYPEIAKASYPDEPKSYADVAAKIGKTPVWIFHGADDPVVPVANSQKMYAALKEAGDEVKYTEYPGVGHDSWVKAYADPELTTWLFSKTLK